MHQVQFQLSGQTVGTRQGRRLELLQTPPHPSLMITSQWDSSWTFDCDNYRRRLIKTRSWCELLPEQQEFFFCTDCRLQGWRYWRLLSVSASSKENALREKNREKTFCPQFCGAGCRRRVNWRQSRFSTLMDFSFLAPPPLLTPARSRCFTDVIDWYWLIDWREGEAGGYRFVHLYRTNVQEIKDTAGAAGAEWREQG